MAKMKKTTSKGDPPAGIPKDFVNRLAEMHTAERELTLALPMVAAAAKSKDLKKVLQLHLRQTREHVKAIDQAAKNLDVDLPMKGCKRMTQLVGDGVKVIAKRLISSEQDDEIVSVGRKIEQFEIDSYEDLCTTAKREGYTHELALLTSVLNQEKMAHELLGQIGAGKGPLNKLVEKASLKQIRSGA
jgi:ferritin-like metal-binding protein YciE